MALTGKAIWQERLRIVIEEEEERQAVMEQVTYWHRGQRVEQSGNALKHGAIHCHETEMVISGVDGLRREKWLQDMRFFSLFRPSYC